MTTKILQVKKFPIYDIFTGQGWLNWTRILVQPGKTTVLAGAIPDLATVRDCLDAPNQAALARKHNQKVAKDAKQRISTI